MHEDAFLDQYMEDRISGTTHWDEDESYGYDPYGEDPFYDYDDEPEEDWEPEPREDFGWFGDEALCGE